MQDEFSRRFGLKVAGALGALAAAGGIHSLSWAAPVGEPAEGAEPAVGGSLTVRAVELGDTMDPAKTGSAQVSTTLRLVGDTLIAKDYDGNYVPWIAESWDISEDGLTWTFQIREGVTFHDGTPLDADAVKFTFDRILDPATQAVTAAGLVGPMVSTKAPDATTFSFTLSEPFAPLLQFLTSSNLSIVSPTAVKAMGDDFGRKPILSGAFMFDEWREGDRVVLKRNPDYAWAPEFMHQDPAGAFIEQITYQSITEDASAVAAFEAGEIQQLSLPATDISRFEGTQDYWIVTYERKGIVTFAFNVNVAPFDDPELRKALMGAISKDDVLDAAVEGYGFPAYSFLSPGIFGYWDGMADYAPPFDPDATVAALEALGWADSDGDGIVEKDGAKLSFTALNLPNDSFGRAAQVVQAQFADVGVEMIIQQMEFATVLEKISSESHQAVFMGYTYQDPDIAYLIFDSSQAGAGINLNAVRDPELDALINEGRSATDPEARAAVYETMQKYVNDQGLFIPLWYDSYYLAFQKSIRNANFHPDNYTVYYDAFVD
ncbi:MAG: ABC transporter substrate-binding protein [Thermomicrobiales bacterium]